MDEPQGRQTGPGAAWSGREDAAHGPPSPRPSVPQDGRWEGHTPRGVSRGQRGLALSGDALSPRLGGKHREEPAVAGSSERAATASRAVGVRGAGWALGQRVRVRAGARPGKRPQQSRGWRGPGETGTPALAVSASDGVAVAVAWGPGPQEKLRTDGTAARPATPLRCVPEDTESLPPGEVCAPRPPLRGYGPGGRGDEDAGRACHGVLLGLEKGRRSCRLQRVHEPGGRHAKGSRPPQEEEGCAALLQRGHKTTKPRRERTLGAGGCGWGMGSFTRGATVSATGQGRSERAELPAGSSLPLTPKPTLCVLPTIYNKGKRLLVTDE